MSINEEEVEEEGQNAALNSDDPVEVEALSYIVSAVAALLSICALTVMLMYRNRAAERRKAKAEREKKRQMQLDTLKHSPQKPIIVQAQTFHPDHYTASRARSDRSNVTSPNSSQADHRPVYLPHGEEASPWTHEQATRNRGIATMPNTAMSSHEPGTVLIDVAGANRSSMASRPRLFAEHASETSEDYTINVPVSDNVVSFPGLVADSLVDGHDEDDVVLFEEEYADVGVRPESVAESEFSDLDKSVTVASAAEGEQVLYAGDLEFADENMERNLSRLTSIATHSTASTTSSAATDMEYYCGPTMAKFFDEREDKMAQRQALAAATAAARNHDDTLAGAPPVGPASSAEEMGPADMANFFDQRQARRETPGAWIPAATSNDNTEPTETHPAGPAGPAGPAEETGLNWAGAWDDFNVASQAADGAPAATTKPMTTKPMALMTAPMTSSDTASSTSYGMPMANFFDAREALVARNATATRGDNVAGAWDDFNVASQAADGVPAATTKPMALMAAQMTSSDSASSTSSGVPMANFFDEREARRADGVPAATTKPMALMAAQMTSSDSASSTSSGVPMANFFDEREARR